MNSIKFLFNAHRKVKGVAIVFENGKFVEMDLLDLIFGRTKNTPKLMSDKENWTLKNEDVKTMFQKI